MGDERSTVLTTAFGLLKDLQSQVHVKVCYLKLTREPDLVQLSEKYENAEVFKTLSRIYKNSDLYVEVSVYTNSNLLSVPIQTRYKPFNNSKRTWNSVLKTSISYNQIDINSYIKFTVYEISNTTPIKFGEGFLSLYNLKNSSLRTGSQKIPLFTAGDGKKIEFYDIPGKSELEKNLIKYENGEFPQNWLDKLTLPQLDTLNQSVNDYQYYLYVELPNFELPIIYSDITYQLSEQKLNFLEIPNSIDIPTKVIYDPENVDPIELKYRKLERNINNNVILDKDIKPSPQLRNELLTILRKPSNIQLNDTEKNLIWKFRYFFSKAIDSSLVNSGFLPKFLKSINWDNGSELDIVFKEIIPNYWSVERIQIGDALELLSKFFNPHTLSSSSKIQSVESSFDKSEEAHFDKIFKYVTFIRKFAVERLSQASIDELLLYLLQLVQALKYEALIYESPIQRQDSNQNFQIVNEVNQSSDRSLLNSPLSKLLIEKSVSNQIFGNYFYWYLKVENEDQINTAKQFRKIPTKIYSTITNKYIDELKKYSRSKKLPYYQYLKLQIWFIKKLTSIVELIRTNFKKNESTVKKKEFLREYLANSSNELLKFKPFPLPLDPTVMICGCFPEESFLFKSSLAPLKITFKTIEPGPQSTSQILKKNYKYGKYPLMFKIGDDLRQDQFVIQIMSLMDQLLKNENLDLKLTPYKILATSPTAGLLQFVPNETLDSILAQTYPQDDYPIQTPYSPNGTLPNGILSYLRLHSKEAQVEEPIAKSVWRASEAGPQENRQNPIVTFDLGVSRIVMDNYVKSCAGYCVITYLLGVGDRHLDNLLLSPNGKFWHADFGYILGRDPKPFPPLMKLPIQVIDGMGGLSHENFNIFKGYCFVTYSTLRKNSNLILNLFELMVEANIPDIKIEPHRAIEKVLDKFCLDMSEEEAILHFQNLINDSVNAFLPVVIDRLHSLAQYWRA